MPAIVCEAMGPSRGMVVPQVTQGLPRVSRQASRLFGVSKKEACVSNKRLLNTGTLLLQHLAYTDKLVAVVQES